MKTLIAFVSGALTGALLLWAGFRQEVVVLGNGRLVKVNRFTGEASYVFVSSLEQERRDRAEMEERERAERAEKERKAALAENKQGAGAEDAKPKAAPAVKPGWRELTAEEVKRLEFKWGQKYGSNTIELHIHNPFEQPVQVEQVRVQIPAQGGRAAVDRMYQVRTMSCLPLSDWTAHLDAMDVGWDAFLPSKGAAAISTESPFGTPPPDAGTPEGVIGSITPVRVLISQ